jgi:NADH-quinone oxidoreductase subunit A
MLQAEAPSLRILPMNGPISPQVLWPMVVYIAAVIFLVAFMLILSALLGEGPKQTKAGNQPYEAGIVSTGSARLRLHAGFYLMAMFFVIFDLEAVFIYAYAAAFSVLGWRAYAEIAVFATILASALFYLFKLGALDWKTPRQKESLEEMKGTKR